MRDRWIEGAAPPPTSERHYYPVLRPEAGKPLRVTILSPVLWACWTHQIVTDEDRGVIRTTPCMGELECPHDHIAIGARWYAFAACQLLETRRRCVAMLSLRGAERIEQLSRELTDLRGLSIEVAKDGGHKAAQYMVSRIERGIGGPLPDAHAIRDSLLALWKVDRLPGDPLPLRPYRAEGGA